MPAFSRLRGVALATAMALAATLAATGTAEARYWHRHHGGFGWGWAAPAFVGGLALGALATPYYGGYYGPRCVLERRVRYTRHGRFVKYKRVCY
jgi:hypothetical protein